MRIRFPFLTAAFFLFLTTASGAERTAVLLDGTGSVDHAPGVVPEWKGREGTIELFVAASWTSDPGYAPCALSHRDPAPGATKGGIRAKTRFSIHISGDRKRVGISDGARLEMVDADFTDGQYHHVALVTRGSRTEIFVDWTSRGTVEIGYGIGRDLSFHLGSTDGSADRFTGAIWSLRLWSAALSPETLVSLGEVDGLPDREHPAFEDLAAYTAFTAQSQAILTVGEEAEALLPPRERPSAPSQSGPDLSGVWVRRDSRVFEKEQLPDPDHGKYRVYPVYLFEPASDETVYKTTPEVGGEKGQTFERQLRDGEQIRRIEVYADEFVQGIELEIEARDRRGKRRKLPALGRRPSRSASPAVLELSAGEILFGIGGTTDGERIVSLEFYTDRRTSPRYGGTGGEPFEILLSADRELRGFAGRGGRELTALALGYTEPTPAIEMIGDDGTLETFIPAGAEEYRSERRTLRIVGPGQLRVDDEPFERVPDYPEIEDKAAYGDPFGVGNQLYNAEFSYRSYDASRLHPFDFKERGAARPVFDFPGEQGTEYYIRNRAIIPNGVEFLALDRGGTQVTTTIHTSESSYNQELSKSLSLSLGAAPVASFTRNEEYKESINRMYAEEKTYTFGEARVAAYALVLDKARIKLDESFRGRVEELARTRDYSDFIGAYGTHYPYAVTFGGRGILQMEMDKTTYSKLVGQDVNIQNNVNAQIKMVSGGAGFGEGESVSSSFKEEMSSQLDNFQWIGGTAGFGKEGWNVTDRVAPIYLDLRPIDELLAPPFFKDAAIITEVRKELRQAVLDYLAAAPSPRTEDIIVPGERPQRFEVVVERIRVVSVPGEADRTAELSGWIEARAYRPGGRSELSSDASHSIWSAGKDKPTEVRAGKFHDLAGAGPGGGRRVYRVPPEEVQGGGYAQIRGELIEHDREALLTIELSESSQPLGHEESPKLYWRAMRLGRSETGQLKFRPKNCKSKCTEVHVDYRYSRIE